jgi:hypothetical protein
MTDASIRERTAIHEAGHAVIAELLCMNPVSVTIEPTEAALGHLRRRGRGYMPFEKWRDLLVLCAGHVAEGMAPDLDLDLDWGITDPYDVLSWVWPDDKISDSALLWASLQEHSEDGGQRQRWFELAFAQTRRILSNRAVWRSVESLAGCLMERQTLDYAEAADVIDAALRRTKWNREQIHMAEKYASPPQTWIDSREEYRQMAKMIAAYKAKKAANKTGGASQ